MSPRSAKHAEALDTYKDSKRTPGPGEFTHNPNEIQTKSKKTAAGDSRAFGGSERNMLLEANIYTESSKGPAKGPSARGGKPHKLPMVEEADGKSRPFVKGVDDREQLEQKKQKQKEEWARKVEAGKRAKAEAELGPDARQSAEAKAAKAKAAARCPQGYRRHNGMLIKIRKGEEPKGHFKSSLFVKGKAPPKFESIDIDGDGMLDRDEIKALLEQDDAVEDLEAAVAQFMEMADGPEGDGQISQEEYGALLEKFKEQWAQEEAEEAAGEAAGEATGEAAEPQAA